MRFLSVTAAACMACLCCPAWSQTIKPGLWEITSKVSGNSEASSRATKMQEMVANMKPEERQQIEAMLAAQGIKIGAGADAGAMVVQTCVTPSMAARNQMLVGQRGSCSSRTSDRTASGMKISFTCANPASSGEGLVSFSSDAAYTLAMNIKSSVAGTPEQMTLDGSGKWLASSCGSVTAPAAAQR